MLTYKIHLIQHGKTLANYEGRYIGRTDIPLSDDGIDELIKLKKEYKYPDCSAVYTSPLTRCKQTAEILYPQHEIRTADDFAEMDFGEFENLRAEDLAENSAFVTWLADSFNNAPPMGEKGSQLLERTATALDQIFRTMAEEEIYSAAVVTHGGIIALLLAACGLPQGTMDEWFCRHGEGYTIRLDSHFWLSHNKFEVSAMLPLDPKDTQDDQDDYDYEYDVYNDYIPESDD